MRLEIIGDPCKVNITWHNDAFWLLSNSEFETAFAALTREGFDNQWLVHAEGRTVTLVNPDEFYISNRADAARECIQLNGGFYRSLGVITNGVAINEGAQVELPTSDNFADSHPSVVNTCYVRPDGVVVSESRDYVPTGGYTQDHARRKAQLTQMMCELTETGGSLCSSPYRPFVVPRVVGTYGFQEILDTMGNPISGIAMLVPHPKTLFSVQFDRWIRSNLQRFDNSLDFISGGNEEIRRMTYHLSISARYLHDYYRKYHGQLTLGNCGRLYRNPLRSQSGMMTYIKDWDTVRALPSTRNDELLARALELCNLWLSATQLSEFLVRIKQPEIQRLADIMLTASSIGMLNTIIGGYETDANRKRVQITTDEADEFLSSDTPQQYAENMRSLLLKYCYTL